MAAALSQVVQQSRSMSTKRGAVWSNNSNRFLSNVFLSKSQIVNVGHYCTSAFLMYSCVPNQNRNISTKCGEDLSNSKEIQLFEVQDYNSRHLDLTSTCMRSIGWIKKQKIRENRSHKTVYSISRRPVGVIFQVIIATLRESYIIIVDLMLPGCSRLSTLVAKYSMASLGRQVVIKGFSPRKAYSPHNIAMLTYSLLLTLSLMYCSVSPKRCIVYGV